MNVLQPAKFVFLHFLALNSHILIFRAGQGPVTRSNLKNPEKKTELSGLKRVHGSNGSQLWVFKGMNGRRQVRELLPRVPEPTRFIMYILIMSATYLETHKASDFLFIENSTKPLINFLKKWIPPAF